MTTRRRFIEILPLAGASLLVACSDKAAAPASTPAAAPAPAPAAAPAPAPTPAAASPTAAAPAAAAAMVDPAEPAAAALGYVTDATKVDTAKFKTYAAGQICGNCTLFTGKPNEGAGPCQIFGGRQVAANGWCSAYVKKTA